MDPKVDIHLDNDLKEVVIRHGEASVIPEPPKNKFSGDIKSAGKYHAVRNCDPQKAIIEFSRNADTPYLNLLIGDKDPYSDSVYGTLSPNPELKVFQLNTGATFSLADISKLILRTKYLFPNKEQNAQLVTSLNSFKASVQTEIEKTSDTRGNRKELLDKRVTSGLPSEFTLEAPIYIGFEKKTFRVEIAYDVTDGGVRVWLDSPELIELMKTDRDAIIDAELAKFTGFVQIEK